MKKKVIKYGISFIIGIIGFIIGFSLFFFMPMEKSDDNISSSKIDEAIKTKTMLKISVDELDIVNENKEIIGRAHLNDVYEVISIDKDDKFIKYKIKYAEGNGYIVAERVQEKKIIEIINKVDKVTHKLPITTTRSNGSLSIDAIKEYVCDDSYTLEEDKCEKVEVKDAKQEEKAECSGTYNSMGECTITIKKSLVTKMNEYCSNNGLNDNKVCCEKSGGIYQLDDSLVCYQNVERVIEPKKTIKYVCEDGWTLKDTKCEKKITIKANYKYICPKEYNLDGNKCIKK